MASFAKYVSYKMQLKNRHFLTRSNRVRLRYVTITSIFIFVSFLSLTLATTNSNAVNYTARSLANIDPAAGANLLYSDHHGYQGLNNAVNPNFSLASLPVQKAPEPLVLNHEVVIESGDVLSKVMEKNGVGNSETQGIIKAMKPYFDPRNIKVGQKIEMNFDSPDGENKNFSEMKIKIDSLKTLVVARADEGFTAHVDEKAVEKKLKAKQAQIEVSLSGSAAKAGIPSAIVSEAIRIYSWNVDFQRDIRPNDTLEVLYESYETDEGIVAKNGDILYAKLKLGDREIPLYRYTMSDGRVDYFQPDGRSIKRTLMKTPINGARMSSGFGKRRHPVLGYTKMHKGVDFAAPTGTPILAAGDGVIERAGWFSSYGKYVSIRHNSKLKTAYAHMSKISSKLKPGTRVKQGDVIGYVGTTGRSTGPHLHYEVLSNGTQVNPRDVNLPTGEELAGAEKAKFQTVVNSLRQQYAATVGGTKVASFKDLFFN
ncbi:MAG TPA: peptidoglycan DD-metalloendopeptidase family protein [Alphaproteobacteria bacterium]|nr:peptidoglycan DD-metalloendopeptidase family protein [Alphaproteobacteria bacterium]